MGAQPYREPVPPRPDPYAAAWVLVKRRRRLARVAYGAVFVVIASAMVGGLSPTGQELPLALVVLLAAAGVIVIWSCQPTLPCPRCAAPFFGRSIRQIGLWEQCGQCGIQVDTTKETADRADRGDDREREAEEPMEPQAEPPEQHWGRGRGGRCHGEPGA
jgi:hypothetical protein